MILTDFPDPVLYGTESQGGHEYGIIIQYPEVERIHMDHQSSTPSPA